MNEPGACTALGIPEKGMNGVGSELQVKRGRVNDTAIAGNAFDAPEGTIDGAAPAVSHRE